MLIVVTPATSHRLTTVDAVRSRLVVGGEVSDERILEWVDSASLSIAGYCERVFGRERVRQIIQSPSYLGSTLQLGRLPAEIISLRVDGQALPAEQYYLDAATGRLARMQDGLPGVWWGGVAVVEYWAGWIMPGEPGRTLPADLETACLLLISAERHAEVRDPQLRSRSTEGVGAESYTDYRPGSGGMPQGIAERLARHVRYTVA